MSKTNTKQTSDEHIYQQKHNKHTKTCELDRSCNPTQFLNDCALVATRGNFLYLSPGFNILSIQYLLNQYHVARIWYTRAAKARWPLAQTRRTKDLHGWAFERRGRNILLRNCKDKPNLGEESCRNRAPQL